MAYPASFAALLAFCLNCAAYGIKLNDRDTNYNATYGLTRNGDAQCSGVALTSDGYFLTAWHCLGALDKPLTLRTNENGKTVPMRIVAYDQERDLALLKAEGHQFKSVVRLHGGDPLRPGDTVYHVGLPFGASLGMKRMFGVGYVMHPKLIVTYPGLSPQSFIHISMGTGYPGASGSGAYHAQTGGLIGTIDGGRKVAGEMYIVLVVPVEDIRAFLLKHGIIVPTVKTSFSSDEKSKIRLKQGGR